MSEQTQPMEDDHRLYFSANGNHHHHQQPVPEVYHFSQIHVRYFEILFVFHLILPLGFILGSSPSEQR